jgi:DNA mismatch repair protein MutL
MELTTYYEGDRTGTTIRFEGGKEVFLGPAPPRKGTAITVKNLFYNVPARRKFLKSEISEKRKISEIIRRYLIAHPEIGFKIHHDGRPVSTLPATEDLRERLESVWGDSVTDNLVELEGQPMGPMTVHGFVSKPEVTRSNRSEIFFFVNRRPVLEKSFFGAIAASYGPALPPGRHPYAAVFMEIEPGFIDINVHPAKTEVRFADDGFIFTTLKKSLDKALSLPLGFSIRPASEPGNEPGGYPRPATIPFERARQEAFSDSGFNMAPTAPASFEPSKRPAPMPAQIDFGGGSDSFLQIFDTYILTRQSDEMLIIDQHTAHERILFERNLNSFEIQGLPSQKLLFEEQVRLSPEEQNALETAGGLLAKAGFEIRPFGGDQFIISGVPLDMESIAPAEALKETLAILEDNLRQGQDTKRALAAAVACKAAIKAGHRLSETQMRALIGELYKCQEPYRCPHGRPTIVVMNRDDLEKIFRRK